MKGDKQPLVSELERLRDRNDRAALARLRRGLGKPMGTPEMYPYVVPFLPENGAGREHYFLIASLFALHPDPGGEGRSMGAVFKSIMAAADSDSIEKRFVSLLSADGEDIGKHLRHAVSLARNKGIAVDYHRLLYDLRFWNHSERFVQLNWAKDFWSIQSTDASEKGEDAHDR